MTTPLIVACLWVVTSAITAFLPLRRQMIPGITPLLAAPVLLVWIGYVHGWLWLALGLFAFALMFRRPLIYFYKKARRMDVPLPEDLTK
jgi:hypothetical protein